MSTATVSRPSAPASAYTEPTGKASNSSTAGDHPSSLKQLLAGLPCAVQTYAELRSEGERHPAFVVPHLLVRGLNLWYGPPKNNKTSVTTALAHAAVTGGDFLGHSLGNEHGEPTFRRVILLVSEVGGKLDYSQWLGELGLAEAPSLEVVSMFRPWTTAEWRRLAHALQADEQTLIVLDNLSASTDGSVTKDECVKVPIQGMGECLRQKAVGLILGHATNSTMTEGGKPLGSTYIESAMRWVVEIRKPHKDDDEFCSLKAHGNWGRTHQMTLQRGDYVASWSVVEDVDADRLAQKRTETKQAKRRKTNSRNGEIAAAVVANCQGMNKKQTGEWIAGQNWPDDGGSPITADTAEKNLAGRGRQYGALLSWSAGVWTTRTP